MKGIYLQGAEGHVGPFQQGEVRAAYQRCEHASSTMSWMPGERSWISLEKRWGHPSKPSRHTLAWVVPVALLLFFGTGILLPLGALDSAIAPAFRAVAVHVVLAILVGLMALVALANYTWRSSREGRVRLRVALSCLAFSGMVLASVALLRQEAKVERVRRQHPDATIALSSDGKVLRIDGYIADEFVLDFKAALDRAPNLAYIEISSPGGLIEDAIEVAHTIKMRAIRVRVTSRCASACVYLWAASPSRELGLGGAIGLHQSRLTVDVPADWRAAAMDRLESQSLAILKQAGFSHSLLSKRSGTSPETVEWVGPVELLDEGVSLRVLDDRGSEVGRAEMVMADVLRRDGADHEVSRLFMAYAVAAPSSALRYAEQIRTAQLQSADVRTLAAQLFNEARMFAISRAPDAALVKWASDMHTGLGSALSRNDANACGTLVVGSTSEVDGNSRHLKFQALADLMEAVPEHSTAAHIDPVYAESFAVVIRNEFSARIDTQGYPGEWVNLSNLQRCDFVYWLYSGALDQRPHDAASAIRVIEGLGA